MAGIISPNTPTPEQCQAALRGEGAFYRFKFSLKIGETVVGSAEDAGYFEAEPPREVRDNGWTLIREDIEQEGPEFAQRWIEELGASEGS